MAYGCFSQTFYEDSLTVRAILDSNGYYYVPVDSNIIHVNNGRIVYLIFHWGAPQIYTIPSIIENLTGLETLNVYGTQITSLPESFGNLSNLLALLAVNCDLVTLPESFGNLDNLVNLDLCNSNINKLPDSFGNLKKLKKLKLRLTPLTYLPESFCNITSLETLDCYNGNLDSLPESFGNLINLKCLDLYSNNLLKLPESIVNIQGLTFLDICGNSLCSLPINIQNWIDSRSRSDWRLTQNCYYEIDSTQVKLLYGVWDWIRSSGGFAGTTITPVTQGYSISLRITPDTVFEYRDDSLIYSGLLVIRYVRSIYNGNFVMSINSFGIFNINADTLYVCDNIYDGFCHTYSRNLSSVMLIGNGSSSNQSVVSALPNPFSQYTMLSISNKNQFYLKIFDMYGKPIKTLNGKKNITWDGTDNMNHVVPNGIYYLQAVVDGQMVIKQIVKIK